MLFSLKKQKLPGVTVDFTFPVRGHSFLPADRVFGRIEQDIRKQETVLLPEEYIRILEKHARVHRYGEKWQCFDYKLADNEHCQSKRSFKIGEAKVLRLDTEQPDKIGFKQVYNGEFCYHSIPKRGKNWDQCNPILRQNINCAKSAKNLILTNYLMNLV